MVDKKMKILFAAAECAPFAKAGGLGDVIGSLPIELKKLGCDIRVIMPLYGSIDRKKSGLKDLPVRFKIASDSKMRPVKIWESQLPGSSVPVYFIDSPRNFGAKKIYGTREDQSERFLFFSLAALEALPALRFKPDLIHCHDYHTALIPDILKARPEQVFFRKIRTVYTIHNLNYQGISNLGVLSTGNLSPSSLKTLARDARDGDINFMVQGILNSDRITTVSKAYAREIKTSFFGAKLEKVIAKRSADLSGILNGIDERIFNPATDKNIRFRFNASSMGNKAKNKLELQKLCGFEQNPDIPMAGMIGRLAWQKGIELIDLNYGKLGCQFAVLGSGDPKYEEMLKSVVKKNPHRFKFFNVFDEKTAHLIYAGSDILAIPSRFEPCGLTQMIAMRYGTVPVARATGGLKDTINAKTGFLFRKFSKKHFEKTLSKALRIYRSDRGKWNSLRIAGMCKDWSWKKSAEEYIKLYKKTIRKNS
jgi:starch synthase